MQIAPITLTGRHAQLVPLDSQHLDGLKIAAADGKLWEHFFTSVPAPDQTEAWHATAKEGEKNGNMLPFTVLAQGSDTILGSTRYCNIDCANLRLEIGYTWYAKSVQRTGINTECKLMLLSHAFEILGCNVVEFRTDWLNKKSQAAITRLGAKQDGILRSHMVSNDGRVRDTVVFSVLKHEWPGVKRNLEYFLARNSNH